MTKHRAVLLATLLLSLGAAAFGSLKAAEALRERRIRQLVPELDAELVHHLVADDDARWFTWCRKAGTDALGKATLHLSDALRTPNYRQFVERREPLERALLRVSRAYRVVFGFPANETRTRHDMAMTPERDFEIRGWERRYIELSRDAHLLPPAARIATADSLSRLFLQSGDPQRYIFAAALAATWEVDRGSVDSAISRLENLAAMSRTHGEHYMLCQILGQLGTIHRSQGRADSMRACFDEGIAVATRHKLVEHAARLLNFYAVSYSYEGRPAAAVDRLTEAVRLCAQPGGEGARARLQLGYMKFIAELECWDLVERGLRRMPPLLRAIPDFAQPIIRSHYQFEADVMRARLDFARGRVDEASRRMRELAVSCPPESRRNGVAEVLDHWSAGLEAAGRHREAAEVCARGIFHCDSANVPQRALRMRVRSARLATALGDLRGAGARLDSLELRREANAVGPALWRLEEQVARARLLGMRGRRDASRRLTEEAFESFLTWLRDSKGAGSAVLSQSVALDLRDLLCETENLSTERSYGFEMEWVSLTRELCMSRRSARELLRLAVHQPRARPPHDGAHLVYRFIRNRLVRWTAQDGRVVVDTLDVDINHCLALVKEAVDLLQKEAVGSGGLLGPEAEARLGVLSKLLLPAGLPVSRTRPLKLDVTPDGPLVSLPFAALPYACGDGRPSLVMTADIAYCQAMGDEPSKAEGVALIVSNPKVPADIARRYDLETDLHGPGTEVSAVLARWPGARILSGEGATKRALTEQLPGAPIFYLASHHVTDLDAPSLGFVPMAAAAEESPDAAMLEIADIHALDLTRCRLAVLASCASSAPYRVAGRPGRSLGDAFIEAGASAVVGSFWDVTDAEARDFMQRFLRKWRADEEDAVNLGAAMREAAAARGTSPRSWAAWSVQSARTGSWPSKTLERGVISEMR